MNDLTSRKIAYYLYSYKDTEKIIEEIKESIIDTINVSANSWRKGITIYNNTLENQVVKLIENKQILDLKRWQVLNKKVFAFLLKKYPKYYEFVKLKYLENKSKDEIREALKINFKEQKNIKDKLFAFIEKNAKFRNLI